MSTNGAVASVDGIAVEEEKLDNLPNSETPLFSRPRMTLANFTNFSPHPLLRSGHAQTIAAAFWKGPKVSYRAERREVAVTQGDHIVLHDDRPATWRPGQRCVILIHGLGGSHLSPYMVRITEKLTARGMRVVRMDMRGSGAGDLLAQHPGHAGRSEDVRAAVEAVRELCPQSSLVMAGFSLGANLLLKYLGEEGDAIPSAVERAMAVAPPMDLQRCSAAVSQPGNAVYDRAFVKGLLRHVRHRQHRIPAFHDISLLPKPRSLFEFDDRVTAPLSGFSGANDYYARCSAAPLLPRIAIPTLILSAADDPLIPAAMFRDATLSSTTTVALPTHGGHVGFIGRRCADQDRFWMDWRVVEYLS